MTMIPPIRRDDDGRYLRSIAESLEIIARRMDELPELLEENGAALDKIAEQLERLRLSSPPAGNT
jgi:hypothetical protein